jgi:hypothetical protein
MKHHTAPLSITMQSGIASICDHLQEVNNAIERAEQSLIDAVCAAEKTDGLHRADLALATAATDLAQAQQLVKLHRNRCIQASRGRRAA